MKKIIKKLLILLIMSPLAADNNDLRINLIGTLQYGGGRVSCDEFVQIRYRYKHYSLFENGIPDCEGNEVPSAWVETKKNINNYLRINCDIPCAVYQMPLKGGLSGNYLGHIKNSQKIFIKDEIKTIRDSGSSENRYPWYREWYSFEYKGDIYYTTKANFK